ncbi:hypothetical protein J0H33_04540 [bacterium]|nr:hypothetical protein [bacterium]
MSQPRPAALVGIWGLPIYAIATLLATLTHQPDYRQDFRSYAEYITTDQFIVGHLAGSIVGTTVGLLGTIALYSLIARGRSARPALVGLVCSVSGICLIMTLFGAAAYAQPALGNAYLDGELAAVAINDDLYGTRTTLMGVAGVLLYAVGAVAFGVAIRREGLGPRWVGPAFAVSIILIAVIGLAIGTAQTVGASLLIVTSLVIVRSAMATGGTAAAR